jgi:iron complex transport system permease protein
MILADLIARTVLAPVEVPIGVVTALFGAPFFLYLLRRQKKVLF